MSMFRTGAAALAFVALAAQPAAACLTVKVVAFDGFRAAGSAAPSKVTYGIGQLAVVCVKVEQDYFVSVWDTAPDGQQEQLYPNVVSHPGQVPKGELFPAGTEKCLGSEKFTIFMDEKEGAGVGKFAAHATATLEAQEEEVGVNLFSRLTPSLRAVGACTPDEWDYFEYTVE